MKKYCCLLIILTAFTASNLFAQEKDYKSRDEFVKKLGPLNNLNVATIADTITRNFADKHDKARAIFCWIAYNIELDPKAVKSNDNRRTDPVDVIQLRKTTPWDSACWFRKCVAWLISVAFLLMGM